MYSYYYDVHVILAESKFYVEGGGNGYPILNQVYLFYKLLNCSWHIPVVFWFIMIQSCFTHGFQKDCTSDLQEHVFV